jgi:hypothetical protein
MKIVIDPFDQKSVANAAKELERYKRWVQEKEEVLRQRLAHLGATVASIEFSRAIYNGAKQVSVRVEDNGRKATIFAEGSAVLFIEFGSGEKYGGGHPDAAKFGYGPGTYSDGPNGKGHWNDPDGWYFAHGQHTFGNPPAMAMVHARDAMLEQLTAIAREVFQ